VLFYGTSITQGGCASRPGMCHTAIVGRRLDRPVINLGFSGNGIMEPEVAALLAELDAAAYVIESVPNMSPEQVAERTEPLVRTIRKAHPTTPIVLVEDPAWPAAFLNEGRRKRSADCRAALRRAYDALVVAGDQRLTYLSGDPLIGPDGEGTVDGTHPTDLGFLNHANAYVPVLEKILAKQ
jgi:lysophospholipase L1-like esterase